MRRNPSIHTSGFAFGPAFGRIYLVPVLILIFLSAMTMNVAADITIILKNGNIVTIPVKAEDILGISFSDGPAAIATILGPRSGNEPTALPVVGPDLWLDASDSDTLYENETGAGLRSGPGGTVGLWKDKSGFGRDFKKPAQTAAPTLAAEGMNGLPAILFAPGKALAVMTDFPAPITIFCVARQTGGANNRVLTAVGNNWLLGYWMGYKNQAYYEGWVNQYSKNNDVAPHLFTGIVRGKGADSEIWADGSLVAAGRGGITGPKGLSINYSPYATEQSDCMVSEILVYSRVLSEAERMSVESWLSSKWKIRF